MNQNFYLQHLQFGSHNAFSDFICILKCILRGFQEMSNILCLSAKNPAMVQYLTFILANIHSIIIAILAFCMVV